MGHTLSTLAYLVASVLFILALRGLSHPTTSRRGNLMGMVGMGIAVLATLAQPGMSVSGIGLIIAAAVFLIWAKLRPIRIAETPDESTDTGTEAAPGTN